MVLNGLESKLLSLAGVEKSDDGKTYTVEGQEFVKVLDGSSLHLLLSEACKKKLSTALQSEPRATFDDTPEGWVTLNYNDDVDVEFIFLYVRYSWKFLRADLT